MNFETKEQKGISLLFSLVVSFGIVALLTTITIPFLRKYQPNLNLNSSARELVNDLRHAQQLTISEQTVYYLDLDFSLDSYQLMKTGSPDEIIETTVLPGEVSFQQITGFTDDEIRFNAYGAVSESGQIILVSTNNTIKTINIKPSGYVQLE